VRLRNRNILVITCFFLFILDASAQQKENEQSYLALNKTSDNWIDFSKPHLKIGVAADGIYRIGYNDLLASGFNPGSVNPNKLVLYTSGKKIPIYVSGREDNRIDVNDYIEFAGIRKMGGNHRETSQYNQPYKEYLGRYTDTTVYWLTWRDDHNSVIDISDANPSIIPKSLVDYYYEVAHYERNVALDYSIADIIRKELPYWTENKTWIESLLNVGIKDYQLAVSDIYPNQKAYIYAKLQDYASNISTRPHVAAIGINNSIFYDTTEVGRYQQAVLSAEINTNQLNEGNNTLKIQSFPTDGSINVLAMDWVELEYSRRLKALNDILNFSFPYLSEKNIYEVRVTNINNDEISIWKYGTDGKKYSIYKTGSEISIVDTINSEDRFFISHVEKIKSPKFYYTKQFSNLRSNSLSFDYVLITHNKFKEKVNEYGLFVAESYNQRVIAVDVDDIYDKFSYGFFNPEAIRDFLKYAYYNWQPPSLQYVCLVGGATYDYHGNKAKYQGAPRFYNYVPSFGTPVSDSWFVIFDSSKTLIPEISIGRIPVTTTEEFDWYFSKHKEYLNQPFNAWNKKSIFFSGGTGNDQNQIDALRNVNEFIINNYITPKPYSAQYTHFYKTINPVNNFGPYTSAQINSVIDSGGVFISYLGHSGTQTWDNSITDPKQLQNKVDRYPLITDFGCSTARFAEPDVISFSQSFVNSGQAIAYIANSSLGFTSTSYNFPQMFYKKLLKDSVYTIGDAHRLAKLELLAKYGSTGVYQLFALTNTLIGDPIVKLKIPAKPNLIISANDIKIMDTNFSDTSDSLTVKVKLYNYGLAVDGLSKINIESFHNNISYYSKVFSRVIPDYADSIFFKLPIKGRNGLNKIIVKLDSEQQVNEIYENDNYTEIEFVVSSGSIKYFVTAPVENYLKNPVRILSPNLPENPSSILIDISENENFIDSKTYQVVLDTIKTDFIVDQNLYNKRLWLRAKMNPDDTNNVAISFKLSTKNSFSLFDSLSFSNQYVDNFKVRNSLYLDSAYITFRLLSAGLNDGNTALILKDGQNYIPENTLRGHHVAIFKGNNYEFAGYKLFDIYGGGTAVTNEYIKFLDTLSSEYLVAFTLSDEGTVGSAALKNKIKEFGSKYIDNVSFRSSWVMLGRKGAPSGSVVEKYAKQYLGRVEIDSVILSNNRHGELKTNLIGPAGKWNKINLGSSGNFNSFSLDILGKRGTSFDTLFKSNSAQDSYDISSIDAVKYPFIKVDLSLYSKNINDVVKLDSLIVDYAKPPELVTNYQTVSVSKDTLQQGENIDLRISVYNVGERTAKNFKVTVDLLKSDNSKSQVFETLADSIRSDQKKNFDFSFDTRSITGTNNFLINIDQQNMVTEIYKDNNYFTVPFFVQADENRPAVQIKFDDVDIFDGDYISPKPDIKIDISDNSVVPIADTSSVELYLNNQRLYFEKHTNTISYTFSNTNPKMIIKYGPSFENGEYTLKVIAKNPNNSTIEQTIVQKQFLVSNEAQILYVYNYPNPFSDNTYFTFKLTQIPDEFKIKIYTLTGRLIKEIVKPEAELNYDFNRIEWDGRDEDGSLIANGIYLYKVIMRKGSETITTIQKLAIMR
jgi:hypothetical protein